jgi:hypothetical protein
MKTPARNGRRGVGECGTMGALLRALPAPLHGQGQETWQNTDI